MIVDSCPKESSSLSENLGFFYTKSGGGKSLVQPDSRDNINLFLPSETGLVRMFPVSSNRGILPQHSDMGARVPGDGLSCILRMCACSGVSGSLQPHGLQPTRLLCPWNFLGKNTGVGCHFLFQGIFPTQG